MVLPIRTRVVTEFESLIDIERVAEEFGDIVYELLGEVHQEISPEVIVAMANKPAAVRYPIVWQTERQRRAFFASNGFGSGIPYRRTDDYIRNWRVDLRRTSENRADWIISNADPKARYVGGSLSYEDRFQQRMHIATGWQKSIHQTNYWQNEFIERVDAKFDRYIDTTFGEFSFSKRNR